MKKSLIVLIFLAFVSLQSYADITRASTLANPVALVDDTSILSVFPSRLQSFDSRIYINVLGNTVFNPGVTWLAGPMMGLNLEYPGTPIAIPNMAQTQTPFPPGSTLNSPVSLIWGAKLGKNMLIGVKYQNAYVAKNNYTTNGSTVTALDHSLYIQHILTPSLTMKMGGMSLDIAVNAVLQGLINESILAGVTNKVTPASMLNTIGVTVQLSFIKEKSTVAIRVAASHINNNYSSVTGTAAAVVTTALADNLSAVLGLKIAASDSVDLYGNLRYSLNETLNNATLTKIWTVIPSFDIGAEVKRKAWRFRAGITESKTATTTENAGTFTESHGNTISTALGIGYQKDAWEINAQISAALFNSTIYVVSGTAITPITMITVNYKF